MDQIYGFVAIDTLRNLLNLLSHAVLILSAKAMKKNIDCSMHFVKTASYNNKNNCFHILKTVDLLSK